MGKLPAIQFYPGDWKKDPGIQALTLEEKGAWFEMLLLMWESEERGKLLLNGNPYPVEMLATALGSAPDRIKQILSKLQATGVASVEQNSGVIYNRRMLKDERLRKIRARAGKKGGSKAQAKRKQKSTPSSSSSSSASAGLSTSASQESKTEAPVDAEMQATMRELEPFKNPADATKLRIVQDLLRQGVTHERIRSTFKANLKSGFYAVVKMLENRKTEVPFKSSPPRIGPPPEPRGEVQKRRDNALELARTRLAEVPQEEIESWKQELNAEAEEKHVPQDLRPLLIESGLLAKTGKKFGIEGV